MTTFRITFELKSSILTPFQADIIWGHFAWAYRYLKGADKLKNFIDSYAETPTLVSNAFPEGLFPRPILKPLTIQQSMALAGSTLNKKGKVKHLDELKRLKKRPYFPYDLMMKSIDDLSYFSIYEKIFKDKANFEKDVEAPRLKSVNEVVSHNTIGRLTNTVTTLGSGFFQKDELFFNRLQNKGLTFWLLVRSNFWNKSDLEAMMEFIEYDGFGADKSTGKGTIVNSHVDDSFSLPQAASPNAFISLSNFVPGTNLGSEGYYDTFCKFGKLGAEFARLKNPFKMPIMFMKAGSTFYVDSVDSEYFGCLLDNINYEEALKNAVKQYAYEFPFYVHVSE